MKQINLRAESLYFSLGHQILLNNVSLTLSGNQIITLLGPNGAGKSTLIKALAAHLFCQSGDVYLNEFHSDKNRVEYLKLIGYMPEKPLVINELNVYEQLKLIANCKKLNHIRKSIERVVKICQLDSVLLKRTKNLSLGFKQRLNLAQAIINNPKVLIMDEPLNGLDPHLIIELRNIMNELKKTTLIIFSTHYLAEAQNVSDRILIMQNGHLLDNIDVNDMYHSSDLEQIYMDHTSTFGETV